MAQLQTQVWHVLLVSAFCTSPFLLSYSIVLYISSQTYYSKIQPQIPFTTAWQNWLAKPSNVFRQPQTLLKSVQYMHHRLAFVLLCVPVLITNNAKFQITITSCGCVGYYAYRPYFP